MSKLIWIVIVLVLLVIGGFFLFGGDEGTGDGEELSGVELEAEGYEELESDDDVFDAIDNTVSYIE